MAVAMHLRKYRFFSRCNPEYSDGDIYWARIDGRAARLESESPAPQ
jgi:hypothetical protein